MNRWSAVLAEKAASHWLARSTGFSSGTALRRRSSRVLIRIASNYLSSPGCKASPYPLSATPPQETSLPSPASAVTCAAGVGCSRTSYRVMAMRQEAAGFTSHTFLRDICCCVRAAAYKVWSRRRVCKEATGKACLSPLSRTADVSAQSTQIRDAGHGEECSVQAWKYMLSNEAHHYSVAAVR